MMEKNRTDKLRLKDVKAEERKEKRKIKGTPKPRIACAVCKEKFFLYLLGCMPSGLASRASVYGIIGYYGSDFDMTELVWNKGEAVVKRGLVCDNCVKQLIAEGKLHCYGGYNFFSQEECYEQEDDEADYETR